MINSSLVNRLTWNSLKTGTGSSTLTASLINSSSNSYYKELLVSVHDSNLLYCYTFVIPPSELSSTKRYFRQGYYISSSDCGACFISASVSSTTLSFNIDQLYVNGSSIKSTATITIYGR